MHLNYNLEKCEVYKMMISRETHQFMLKILTNIDWNFMTLSSYPCLHTGYMF